MNDVKDAPKADSNTQSHTTSKIDANDKNMISKSILHRFKGMKKDSQQVNLKIEQQ